MTESLKPDEGFMAALEQMSIDYGSFISCPPEYRLLMIFTAATGRTHAINLFMRKRAETIAVASQEGETLQLKQFQIKKKVMRRNYTLMQKRSQVHKWRKKRSQVHK